MPLDRHHHRHLAASARATGPGGTAAALAPQPPPADELASRQARVLAQLPQSDANLGIHQFVQCPCCSARSSLVEVEWQRRRRHATVVGGGRTRLVLGTVESHQITSDHIRSHQNHIRITSESHQIKMTSK